MKKEMELLKTLNNENIVKYMGSIEDEKGGLHIILEFGTLHFFIC
jgi:hypothetical protein